MQCAGRLVAVAAAELAVADRQVAVAVQALVEHLHVAGAVHRLHRVGPLLGLGEEHVVLVVVPVAGALPQLDVEDLRAAHLAVTGVAVDAAHVLLDHLPDAPALRVPEHQARRLFLQVEQVLLLADPPMIALLCFLDALDVGLQLLLVRPGGAIDALQLLVLGIAAPVRAGDAGELERLEEARVRHVRSTAHVHVFLVEVQAHRGHVGAHVVDQAQLVFLAAAREFLDDLVARGHLLHHVVVLRDQFAHALLDRGQVVRGERALGVDVVVETLVDDRADHHLGVRVQLLHRMADQVRAAVADDLHALLVLRGDDAQAGVMVDDVAGIDQATVDFAGHGGLGQAGTDRLGDLQHGNGGLELALGAVGKGDRDHGHGSGKRKRRRSAFRWPTER